MYENYLKKFYITDMEYCRKHCTLLYYALYNFINYTNSTDRNN